MTCEGHTSRNIWLGGIHKKSSYQICSFFDDADLGSLEQPAIIIFYNAIEDPKDKNRKH